MALGVNVTGIGVPTGIYLLALSKSQQIMSSEWDSVPLNLKSSAAYLDHIKETKRDNSCCECTPNCFHRFCTNPTGGPGNKWGLCDPVCGEG